MNIYINTSPSTLTDQNANNHPRSVIIYTRNCSEPAVFNSLVSTDVASQNVENSKLSISQRPPL